MNKDKIQLAMMIGIYLSIILLLLAIIVIVKNVNEIKSDPISYGINQKGFEVCSCYNSAGQSYDYDSNGPIVTINYGWNLNLEE